MSQLRHNFAKTVRNLLKISGRACKPDSVRRADVNACTLRRSFLYVTTRAVTPAAYPRVLLCKDLRPRRGSCIRFRKCALIEPGRLSPPIWPCTTRGFPCSRYCYRDGGLLPHLFTLA